MRFSIFVTACIAHFIIASIGITAYGQGKKTDFEWGINLGMLVYQGDISPSQFGSLKYQKPFIAIYGTRLLGDHYSLRLNFISGSMADRDGNYRNPDYKRYRNFSFSASVNEMSLLLVLDPKGRNYAIRKSTLYGFAGVGVSLLKVERDWNLLDKTYFAPGVPTLQNLPLDSAKSLPKSTPVFPLGGGIKFFLIPSLALKVEVMYRLTTTDYMDGFSESANPKYRDSYINYGLGILFRPGKKDVFSCASATY